VLLHLVDRPPGGEQEAGAGRRYGVADNQRQTQMLRAHLTAETQALRGSVDQLQAKLAVPADARKEQGAAKADAPTVKQIVASCVKYVRGLETQTEKYSQGFAGFDAFYNPATNRVQNNNQFVDQRAVYAFNKCMASKGMPLSY
jgi:hypothetical protein